METAECYVSFIYVCTYLILKPKLERNYKWVFTKPTEEMFSYAVELDLRYWRYGCACVCSSTSESEFGTLDNQSSSIIRLNNGTILYLREVNKHLALVGILREDSFDKQGNHLHYVIILYLIYTSLPTKSGMSGQVTCIKAGAQVHINRYLYIAHVSLWLVFVFGRTHWLQLSHFQASYSGCVWY